MQRWDHNWPGEHAFLYPCSQFTEELDSNGWTPWALHQKGIKIAPGWLSPWQVFGYRFVRLLAAPSGSWSVGLIGMHGSDEGFGTAEKEVRGVGKYVDSSFLAGTKFMDIHWACDSCFLEDFIILYPEFHMQKFSSALSIFRKYSQRMSDLLLSSGPDPTGNAWQYLGIW